MRIGLEISIQSEVICARYVLLERAAPAVLTAQRTARKPEAKAYEDFCSAPSDWEEWLREEGWID